MDIICRHCNATYTIADHKLPPKKSSGQMQTLRQSNRHRSRGCRQSIRTQRQHLPLGPHGKPLRAQHDRSIMDAFPEISDLPPDAMPCRRS
jgi:hypothetical protein